MRPIARGGLLVVFLEMAVTVFGDTEVINFRTSDKDVSSISIPWGGKRISLHLNTAERITMTAAPPSLAETVQRVCDNFPIGGSCPYEYWLALPAHPYGPKTLRLSWPASYPAEFSINIYSAEELISFIHEHWERPHPGARLDPRDGTYYVYARILAKSRGIQPPSSSLSNSKPLEVPANVIYESLLLGVLPLSLLPTVVLVVVLAMVAGLCVQPITAFLDKIARPLRNDLPPLKED